MPPRTYHVALAFQVDQDGELQVTSVSEAPTPQSAVSRAKRLAGRAKGAVAFSRSGDTDLGEYGDAKVHIILGELPSDIRDYVSQVH